MGAAVAYIISLLLGLIIGIIFKGLKKHEKILDICITAALYVLLVFMGLKIGSDDNIFNNLGTIGFNSFILAISVIIGSIFFTRLFEKILGRKR